MHFFQDGHLAIQNGIVGILIEDLQVFSIIGVEGSLSIFLDRLAAVIDGDGDIFLHINYDGGTARFFRPGRRVGSGVFVGADLDVVGERFTGDGLLDVAQCGFEGNRGCEQIIVNQL